jgi:hypothetical protein
MGNNIIQMNGGRKYLSSVELGYILFKNQGAESILLNNMS